MKNRHLESIQILRGVAAMLVLFFHLNAISCSQAENCYQWTFSKFWREGYWGVDLFFVISGFVMVHSTKFASKGIWPAAKFILTRFCRIFPTWWCYAGIMGLYFYVSYGYPAPPDKLNQYESVSFIIKSMLLIPQGHAPVLGVGWTLIHEIGFYLLFALTLLTRYRLSVPIFVLWAILICLNVTNQRAGFMANGYMELFLSPFGIEFLIGVLIGMLYSFKRRLFGLSLPIFLFTILLLLTVMTKGIDQASGYFDLKRSLIYGGLSGFLIFSTLGLEKNILNRVPNLFKLIGDWSYSLYLSHMLVLLVIRRVWEGIDSDLPEALRFNSNHWIDEALFWTIGIISCILFSKFSYNYLERPLYYRLRQKFNRSQSEF